MVRDVAFGQYFPANSVIHKCDPRAKLIMLVGFLVIIFCTFNYASLALVVLFTALFVAASKVPAKFYFKSMKVIIFIIIVTSILKCVLRFWLSACTMGNFQNYLKRH